MSWVASHRIACIEHMLLELNWQQDKHLGTGRWRKLAAICLLGLEHFKATVSSADTLWLSSSLSYPCSTGQQCIITSSFQCYKIWFLEILNLLKAQCDTWQVLHSLSNSVHASQCKSLLEFKYSVSDNYDTMTSLSCTFSPLPLSLSF